MKKSISLLLMVGLLMTVLPLAAAASAQEVVSLGANLTQQQKEEILNYFGVDEQDAKKTANEELVVTTELAEEVGPDKAAEFIKDVKTEVVKENLKEPQEITEAVQRIAVEHNIELTDAQIQQIRELMEKISRLDLNLDKIRQQLDNIDLNIDDIKDAVKENQGILQKISHAINSFFNWVKTMVEEIIG
jgi:uncharacterized protein YpuA (DUF1002 family)